MRAVFRFGLLIGRDQDLIHGRRQRISKRVGLRADLYGLAVDELAGRGKQWHAAVAGGHKR